MRSLFALVIATAVVAIGVVVFAYSGLYDVSASSSHSGPINWLLSTTSRSAIQHRARSIEVPDLGDESLVRAGVNDFEAMCAGCHGAPGRPRAAVGEGLNPPAPDLGESAQRMTPAELFWVTKHGIKMTGMPAWGATHDDASLWPVVAFMTRLPRFDAEKYEEYLSEAAGFGHHAGTDEHNDRDRDDSDASASSEHEHPETSGSDHADSHDHEH